MKVKMAMAVLALFLFAGVVRQASAEEAKKPTHQKTRTLSGCLQKGDDAKEFGLVTKDGSTWEVKSDSVDLGPHVGHSIKVTGVVSNAMMHGMKEDAKEEAKEHGIAKHEKEHGHMTVTAVKMVSEQCKK